MYIKARCYSPEAIFLNLVSTCFDFFCCDIKCLDHDMFRCKVLRKTFHLLGESFAIKIDSTCMVFVSSISLILNVMNLMMFLFSSQGTSIEGILMDDVVISRSSFYA